MPTEYGTSYFGVRNRSHAATDLERFRDEGLNAILHTFSERDQLYYEETMSDIVSESKEQGYTVYVNPWSVGRVFGGEALSEFIGCNPETRQRISTGERVATACFNHPDFRDFMRQWTEAAAGLGADVLFWDEPHWFLPSWFDREFEDDTWGCRCEFCQSAFKEQFGHGMPQEETPEVQSFKAEALLDFLREMMAVAKGAGADNAVCLLPSEDAEHGLADWEPLAQSEDLDVLVTDPYWDVFPEADAADEFVGYFSEKIASLATDHDLRSQIWIQGFRLGPNAEAEVRAATKAAIESGVDGVFMWGYDACKSISSISCEEPEAVWEAYLEEVRAAQS